MVAVRKSSMENKHGREPEMLPVDQLFMFLVWLKNGLNLDFTSWLFNSNKSSVLNADKLHYFYFSQAAIPIWLTKVSNMQINFVDPREHCETLMFYDSSRRCDDIVSHGGSEKKQAWQKTKSYL